MIVILIVIVIDSCFNSNSYFGSANYLNGNIYFNFILIVIVVLKAIIHLILVLFYFFTVDIYRNIQVNHKQKRHYSHERTLLSKICNA